MIKVFDHEKALAVADGDHELFKEMIDLFKEQSPKLLAAIEQAIQSNNAQRLQHAAHTIKGSLSYVAAGLASEVALELELMAREKRLDSADATFKELTKEIHKFEQEIANLEGAPIR